MSKQIDLLESIEEVTAEQKASNVGSIPDRDDVTEDFSFNNERETNGICQRCGARVVRYDKTTLTIISSEIVHKVNGE